MTSLPRIGIVGGVGWPSTIEYYRAICEGVNRHFAAEGGSPPYPTPPISINSLDMSRTVRLFGREGDPDSWRDFDDVFREAFGRLESAGCDFGLIASVTPHSRLASIRRDLTLPVLSILDVAAEVVRGTGATSARVLGTAVTMRSGFFEVALEESGISGGPRLPEREIGRLQALIDKDFYQGVTPEARERLIDFCDDHTVTGSAVILGCTELALAFEEFAGQEVFEADGFLFINPVVAHVEAALTKVLKSD